MTVGGAGLATPFGFVGGEGYQSDPDSGLMLLGARYYDPSSGRFISRDPIGYEGGLNLYAYCENDPVNGIDPDGLLVRWPGWDEIKDGAGRAGRYIVKVAVELAKAIAQIFQQGAPPPPQPEPPTEQPPYRSPDRPRPPSPYEKEPPARQRPKPRPQPYPRQPPQPPKNQGPTRPGRGPILRGPGGGWRIPVRPIILFGDPRDIFNPWGLPGMQET
jgi:RHS repeat-associated protein